MKNKFVKKYLVILIVFLAVVAVIYSIINTKTFDLNFAVDNQTSDVDIENVFLRGTMIKFPFNIYYIKGTLDTEDNIYTLTNYKRIGTNETVKKNIYRLKFIDNDNSSFFWGEAKLIGDIINDKPLSLHIEMTKTDEKTGYTNGKNINCHLVD